MAHERTGAVTLGGNPVTLIGPELRVGDKAPDFALLTNDRRKAHLTDYKIRHASSRLFLRLILVYVIYKQSS